jgi:hypothetical protein
MAGNELTVDNSIPRSTCINCDKELVDDLCPDCNDLDKHCPTCTCGLTHSPAGNRATCYDHSYYVLGCFDCLAEHTDRGDHDEQANDQCVICGERD